MYLFGGFLGSQLLQTLLQQEGLVFGNADSGLLEELRALEEVGDVADGARLLGFFGVLLLYDQGFVIIDIFFNLVVIFSKVASYMFFGVLDLE